MEALEAMRQEDEAEAEGARLAAEDAAEVAAGGANEQAEVVARLHRQIVALQVFCTVFYVFYGGNIFYVGLYMPGLALAAVSIVR